MGAFVSLEQMLGAVRARWRLAVAVAGLTLLTFILVTLMMPTVYTGEATIVFNNRDVDPIETKGDSLTFNNYLSAEMDLMGSRRVIERLTFDPAFLRLAAVRDAYAEHGGGRPISKWLTRYVTANITVSSTKNSRAVKVSADADSAEFAAAIANGLARAYLLTNLELRISPEQQNVQFFRREKKRRYLDLVAAQRQFDTFLRTTGMTGLEGKSDIADVQLRTLSEQSAQAQAELAGSAAEDGVGGADTAVSAGQIGNPVVQRIKGDIAEQSAVLRDMKVLRGPNYPTVLQAEERLRELRNQFAAETGKIQAGLERRRASLSSRSAQIGALEAGKRQSLTATAGNRSRLAVLSSDVERARTSYDTVSAKLDEAQLAAALAAPNASILSAALPPVAPSSPNWSLNLLLGILAGIGAGIVTAIVAELLRPHIRSRADMERALGGAPVFCEIKV